jgi:tetratricopeptide (TPR) repeat protein
MKRALLLPLIATASAAAWTAHHHLVPAATPGPATQAPPSPPPPLDDFATELATARAACDPAALTPVFERLVAASQTTSATPATWHRLAATCLERCLLHSHRRGLAVGTPTWSTLPAAVASDVDQGLAAVEQARAHGETSADLHRLEAALLGQRITGVAAALRWNGRIEHALAKASELAPDDPRVQVALGLRKLLAPPLLGHDPVRALAHFTAAAEQLPEDERPAVFAAFACHLQDLRSQALQWLEQAVQRNPRNSFAQVVLQRLRAGEAEPFGRDVTDAEVAALR